MEEDEALRRAFERMRLMRIGLRIAYWVAAVFVAAVVARTIQALLEGSMSL